jgi:hypothetical protein
LIENKFEQNDSKMSKTVKSDGGGFKLARNQKKASYTVQEIYISRFL